MNLILFMMLLSGVLFYCLYRFYLSGDMGAEAQKKNNNVILLSVLGVGLVLRLIMAASYVGHETDMNCFISWGDMIYQNGISNFYTLDAFTDYPPGYMYVLYIQGMLRSVLSLEPYGTVNIVLVKLPAILCDLGAAYLIYRIARKSKYHKISSHAIYIMAVYLFNPCILIDSATWGQVDSVLTLFILLMVYFMTENRYPMAYFTFAIGILVKPQALMFGPVLFLGIIREFFVVPLSVNNKTKEFYQSFWKNIGIQLLFGIAAILVLLGLAAPFGLSDVVTQYTQTVSSYPYGSINAYNLWTMAGQNWQSQDTVFFGVTAKTWGMLFILASVLFLCWFVFRGSIPNSKEKNASKKSAGIPLADRLAVVDRGVYFLAHAVFMLLVFTCSVRMHERYLFPAIVLLLGAYIYHPSVHLFRIYSIASILLFFNEAYVLFCYDYENFNRFDVWPILCSIAMVAMAGGMVYYLCSKYQKETIAVYLEEESITKKSASKDTSGKSKNYNRNEGKNADVRDKGRRRFVLPTRQWLKFTKADWLILGVIVLIYSVFALYDLGDMEAPENGYEVEEAGTSMTFDFGKDVTISKISYYLGNYENRQFTVWIKKEADEVHTQVDDLMMKSVFAWGEYTYSFTTRDIFLGSANDRYSIKELVFFDESGNQILPENASEYPELFDEQQLYPEHISFRNGTYFDEIYHARTAYEYIHGLYSYENTHPPLGKIIISLGILIFGMNPFGWRIMGTLFGILMLPVFYGFAKQIVGWRRKENDISTKTISIAGLGSAELFPGLVTTLFAFDFMHFAQTRIATIDVFVTFFIMASYYFMFRFVCTDFFAVGLKKVLPTLALCGTMMGLGIACKWTGVYSAAGLCAIFFVTVILRYLEHKNEMTGMKAAKKETAGQSSRKVRNNAELQMKTRKKGAQVSGNSTEQVRPVEFEKNSRKLLWKLFGFCVIFFILIPAVIYYLSYIPFSNGSDDGTLAQLLKNQVDMYNYHTYLESEHFFASSWYQWPIMYRPIWYYSSNISDTLAEGISAFGNPLVWWVGIPAFFYQFWRIWKKKDTISGFLVIAYLAQYLPWFLIDRTTFIYHYFPSVPFVTLMLGYSLRSFVKEQSKRFYAVVGYTVVAVSLFIMFYPVLSGQPISKQYVHDFLKWFDSWVLLNS